MTAMSRRRPLTSALLSLGLLLSGQSRAAGGRRHPEPGAGPDAEPGPPPAAAPPQNWGSCGQFVDDTSDIPTAQCTTVSVPVDYNNPGGAQAKLAVIRVPATGQRIGSLLVNPGGPGASAVDMVAGMASDLQGHRHRPPLRPGGLRPARGRSLDARRCGAAPTPSSTPSGATRWSTTARPEWRTSSRSTGSWPSSAPTGWARRSWPTSAPRPRRATWTWSARRWATSRSTTSATATAPSWAPPTSSGSRDHVRAMVLDGAIDPTVGPIDENVNQMAGFQTAFNDYAADCARSAACPLGTDPAQWVNRYHALVDPLVAKPGRTSDPRGLSYADATTGTINALYTPQHWKYLTSGLLGLQRGTDAGDLLVLADDYDGRDKHGHYSNDQDAFNAIRCVDAPTPTDAASWVSADQQIRQAAPFLSYGQFTGNAPRDLCALWPVPATSTPHAAPRSRRARSSWSRPRTTRPRRTRPG